MWSSKAAPSATVQPFVFFAKLDISSPMVIALIVYIKFKIVNYAHLLRILLAINALMDFTWTNLGFV